MPAGGTFYYEYDASSRTVKMRKGSANGDLVEQYFYDHSGNRIKKVEFTAGGNVTTYYVSDLFEVTIYPDGTRVNTSYYYANGERIARKVVNNSDAEVYYYHSDHLHSTSVVTKKGRLVAAMVAADNNWSTISLNETLIKPVVIAKIMTENDGDNTAERIKNVASGSFQLMVEETPAFNYSHVNETLGYIALEEGTVTDGGGEIGRAGVIEAGDVWTRVSFPDKFNTVPVVIASAMSTNGDSEGVVRVRNVDASGFDVRFEEYPSSNDSYHPVEKVGWIALKPGTWTLDGKTIVAGKVSPKIQFKRPS